MEHNPNYCRCPIPKPDTNNVFCTGCGCVIQIRVSITIDNDTAEKLIEYKKQFDKTIKDCIKQLNNK